MHNIGMTIILCSGSQDILIKWYFYSALYHTFLISIIVNFIYPKQTNFLCDTTYATHVMLPLIHSSYHGRIEHKITKENSLRHF